jgi:hypothetical protein
MKKKKKLTFDQDIVLKIFEVILKINKMFLSPTCAKFLVDGNFSLKFFSYRTDIF